MSDSENKELESNEFVRSSTKISLEFKKGFVGFAQYDYDPKNETELSLDAGDCIQLLRCDPEDEWWIGQLYDQPEIVGYFPAKFFGSVMPDIVDEDSDDEDAEEENTKVKSITTKVDSENTESKFDQSIVVEEENDKETLEEQIFHQNSAKISRKAAHRVSIAPASMRPVSTSYDISDMRKKEARMSVLMKAVFDDLDIPEESTQTILHHSQKAVSLKNAEPVDPKSGKGVVRMGYLRRGEKSFLRWPRYYFVLSKVSLSYFKNDEEFSMPISVFPLIGGQVNTKSKSKRKYKNMTKIEYLRRKGRPHCIRIKNIGHKKNWVIDAGSSDLCSLWMEYLEKVINGQIDEKEIESDRKKSISVDKEGLDKFINRRQSHQLQPDEQEKLEKLMSNEKESDSAAFASLKTGSDQKKFEIIHGVPQPKRKLNRMRSLSKLGLGKKKTKKLEKAALEKIKLKERVFNVPLLELYQYSGRIVPLVLVKCGYQIAAEGIHQKGIFRISASSDELEAVREVFDTGHELDIKMSNYNPDLNAGLFKLFLRNLPEPVLTFDMYEEFIDAIEINQEDVKLMIFKTLLEGLPLCHQTVLVFVLHVLRLTINCSEQNLMGLNNIAVVFGPTLLRRDQSEDSGSMFDLTDMQRQIQVVEYMLLNFNKLTNGPEMKDRVKNILGYFPEDCRSEFELELFKPKPQPEQDDLALSDSDDDHFSDDEIENLQWSNNAKGEIPDDLDKKKSLEIQLITSD